jgi:hypothetical protein
MPRNPGWFRIPARRRRFYRGTRPFSVGYARSCDWRCWNATTPRSACRCICRGNNHGGAHRPPPPHQQQANQRQRDEIAKAAAERIRDEAVNRILQKVEASAVVHQPHIAVMIEVARQSYNHRDYLYDVAKELSSNKPADQKFSNVSYRTVQELKTEAAGRLVSGGVAAVSSRLSDIGVFRQPFGLKGPELNETQSNTLRTFFEGTLEQLTQRQ